MNGKEFLIFLKLFSLVLCLHEGFFTHSFQDEQTNTDSYECGDTLQLYTILLSKIANIKQYKLLHPCFLFTATKCQNVAIYGYHCQSSPFHQ